VRGPTARLYDRPSTSCFTKGTTQKAIEAVIRLDNEERKLLTTHYANTISDHIYAEEQARIRRERAAADQLFQRHQVEHETIFETLDLALDLTTSTKA
jgi:hypothetical protein